MTENYTRFIIPGTPQLEVLYCKTAKDYKGCILCVHGVCHGAWCFENFLSYFPENGYDCYAMSLRGHAGSAGHEEINRYGLSDYSDDVKKCIDYCRSETCMYKMKSNPFLIGHSMGGAVAQKYMGDHSNELKGCILFASATAGGMNLFQTFFDTYILHKNLRIAARKASAKQVTDNELFNAAFFDGRIPLSKIKKYNTLLQIESKKIITKDLYKPYTNNYDIEIPVLVIGSYADSYFPEESLRVTADAYKCSEGNTMKQLRILSDLCHDMMLDPEWKKSAKAVLEFMDNNK